MRLQALVLATVGLVACNDPTFNVKVTYDAVTLAGIPPLLDAEGAERATIVVSVIDAAAAGDGRTATCDDIAFGLISPDVLAGARRASANESGGYQLSGVPRLGPKLVIAEARNRARRLALGCTFTEEVTGDETVVVELHTAPLVQVFARTATTAPTMTNLLLTTPWPPHATIAGHAIRVEHHTAGADVTVSPDPVSSGSGEAIAAIPAEPAEGWAAGPAQSLIRVAWSEELVRQPSFRPWPTMAVEAGTETTIPAGLAPRWAMPDMKSDADVPNRLAAVLLHPPAADELITIVSYDSATRALQTRDVPARGARDLTFFNGAVVTLRTDRWTVVKANGMLEETASPGPAASIVATVPLCSDDEPRRLLVRRFDAAASRELYTVYRGVSDPAEADDPVARFAADLNASPGDPVVVGSACISLDDAGTSTVVRAAIVRVTAGPPVYVAHVFKTGESVQLSNVQAIASFKFANGLQARAAAVEATVYGPQVTAYKLARFEVPGAGPLLGLVSDEQIDATLATIPQSFDVFDLGPAGRSVAAALALPGGTRLQVSLAEEQVAGQPLSAVTDLLRCGVPGETVRATNPIVRIFDVNRVGPPELMVLHDAGLDVFCLTAGAEGCTEEPTTCAP